MNTKAKNSDIQNKYIARVLTASVLAWIIIFSIFLLPREIFLVIVTFVFAIASWEWCRLIGIRNIFEQSIYILILVGFLFISEIFFPLVTLFLAVLWWLYAIFLMKQYPKKKSWLIKHKPTLTVVGFLLFVPSFISFLILRDLNPQWLLFGLFVVWSSDTGAFVFGKYYGRHKLAPNISPGKTKEGVIGGVVLALIMALLLAWLMQVPHTQWIRLMALTIVVSLASVVGDLFESMIKREAGVKDSGDWLPGHGGLLDRIDGLLCAMPIFTLGILFLIHF